MAGSTKIKRIAWTGAILLFVAACGFAAWNIATSTNLIPRLAGVAHKPGDVVDSLDGVYVRYNGGVGMTYGRNTTPDGYNLGLKYQCVEFVKRYYYEHYGHRMPDPWGHAKDFFWNGLKDGKYNEGRGLNQYHNGKGMQPRRGDLIVFGPTPLNPYGHVAIISGVWDDRIEIIQQNPGPTGKSREQITLTRAHNRWKVDNPRVLGWLRMPAGASE